MKILYDFRAYQRFYPRGVSRYIFELFSESIRQNDADAFILLEDSEVVPVFDSDINHKITCLSLDAIQRMPKCYIFDIYINGSSCWLGLEGYRSIEILYPFDIVSRSKVVTAILYDFVPLFYRQYIPDFKAEVNYALQLEMVKYLTHVFTISEFVSTSGAKYTEREDRDFTCLYGGANDKKFKTANSERVYSSNNRSNDLVYVSGACSRKNFIGTVTAFCKAYKSNTLPKDARLIIICASSPAFEQLIKTEAENQECVYGKQVVVTGYITDEQLIKYLGFARASIFPSYYEGLGLPILESYAAGTPCFASNISSTKEFVLQEASFNPFDEDEFVHSIIKIYQDDQLCYQSLEYGRALLKIFNWKNASKIMLNKMHELVAIANSNEFQEADIWQS